MSKVKYSAPEIEIISFEPKSNMMNFAGGGDDENDGLIETMTYYESQTTADDFPL